MRRFIFLEIFFVIVFISSCANQTDSITANEKTGKKQLTLMVYMAADNDLETYALQNLKMMEGVKSEGMNILVLLDRAEGYDETEGNWTGSRLYQVCYDKSATASIKSKRLNCPQLGISSGEETELDMANPGVLKGFIEYCKSSWEAENYALIIWGHGNGWRAVTVDDRSSSYMSVHDLGNALRGQGLSVIGFDSCFGAAFENVYELKDCAEFTVACPGLTPSGGWNYRNLLESLKCQEMTAAWISQKMAESAAVQTSIFSNDKVPALMDSFERFSMQLAQTITDSSTQASVFQNLLACKSYSYNQYPCDLYLDIYSIADFYFQHGNGSLSYEAGNLKNAIRQSVASADGQVGGVGIHFSEKPTAGSTVGVHSAEYRKNPNLTNQNLFIKESCWWVPTASGNSASLLDKLFYTAF